MGDWGGRFEEVGFALGWMLSGIGGLSVMRLLNASHLEGRGLAGVNTVLGKHSQDADAGSLW